MTIYSPCLHLHPASHRLPHDRKQGFYHLFRHLPTIRPPQNKSLQHQRSRLFSASGNIGYVCVWIRTLFIFNEAESDYAAWMGETGRLAEMAEGSVEELCLQLAARSDWDRGVAVRQMRVFTSSFTYSTQYKVRFQSGLKEGYGQRLWNNETK